ncbi:MAG: M20/M25/M40 family metallo-hydrolase [Acidimicrobiia bacterium]|jgi:acetylornithine deacetylase/succinyl-diaminopimelate desuccinylase-like protein
MPQFDAAAVSAAVESVAADLETARAELEDLVRIPSISADPERVRDVAESADAVAALMEAAGLEHVRQASVDGSPPCVIGDWLHAPDAPTILLYAHHDVQPAGYAERWSGDPFEPWERDGRLFGRGSADDKAGAVAHVAAVRAWLRTAGALPCNVKVMVEGEEEIGSPRLAPFLAEYGDELRADVLLLADAGNWSVGTPGITYSLRGVAGGTVRLRALESPVHSGMAGGAVPDPVMALARMLTTLVDQRGDPAFDGCWDDWRPPSFEERGRLEALPRDDAALQRAWGMLPGVALAGDGALTVFERLWLRPALTVIGIDGHPIKGSSNQIVSEAAARISVRIAAGQDPDRINAALRDHFARRVPFGMECTYEATEASPAWRCEPTGPTFAATGRALRDAFGVDPVYMGVGGSIPFVGPFADAFGGVPALLLGPADPGSRIHGEDESLHLGDWAKLIDAEARLLAYL